MPIGRHRARRDSAAPTSAPTDTGQWFAAGITDRGPANTPVRVHQPRPVRVDVRAA